MRKTLQELRYKCGRHNTDSAIPDKGRTMLQVEFLCPVVACFLLVRHLMLRPSFALDCHYTLHIAIVDS